MTYSLSGKLITGADAYSWLTQSAKQMNGSSYLCSAFTRTSVIKDLSTYTPTGASIFVLVRWTLGDLLSQASDLAAYELCKELNWKFHICLNFHGKVFYVPPKGILVGSANATESGFSLRDAANSEVCTLADITSDNEKFVQTLIANSYEMNDAMFREMTDIYLETINGKEHKEWPTHIFKEINHKFDLTQKLFISECLKSDGDELVLGNRNLSDLAQSDLSLLGIPLTEISPINLATYLQRTKLWFRLIHFIEKSGGQTYFGEFTSELQGWLIDDPAPYRREVKVLVANLYGWIARLGKELTGLEVDRPNHSQRIRMI